MSSARVPGTGPREGGPENGVRGILGRVVGVSVHLHEVPVRERGDNHRMDPQNGPSSFGIRNLDNTTAKMRRIPT